MGSFVVVVVSPSFCLHPNLIDDVENAELTAALKDIAVAQAGSFLWLAIASRVAFASHIAFPCTRDTPFYGSMCNRHA